MKSCQNTSAAKRGLIRNGDEPKTGLGDYVTMPKSPTSNNIHMCESRKLQDNSKKRLRRGEAAASCRVLFKHRVKQCSGSSAGTDSINETPP
jgi:hypothetical protein